MGTQGRGGQLPRGQGFLEEAYLKRRGRIGQVRCVGKALLVGGQQMQKHGGRFSEK